MFQSNIEQCVNDEYILMPGPMFDIYLESLTL